LHGGYPLVCRKFKTFGPFDPRQRSFRRIKKPMHLTPGVISNRNANGAQWIAGYASFPATCITLFKAY
jgi:hypothetical protein